MAADSPFTHWWIRVRRNPNAKDCYVDRRYDNDRPPLDLGYRAGVISNERNAIDDDLHEQLDLKDP